MEPTDAEIHGGLVEVAAAGTGWVAAPARSDPWQTDPRHTEPLPPKVHSRWKASPQSFSGPVKVAITAVVTLGIPYFFYVIAGQLGIGGIAIWSVIVTPRVVRDLWRRTRVR